MSWDLLGFGPSGVRAWGPGRQLPQVTRTTEVLDATFPTFVGCVGPFTAE